MRKILDQESGFTLTEVVLALAITLIGAAFIIAVFLAGARFNAESEDRTVAAGIAQLKMEEIMNTRFRYITHDHPPGETSFESKTQDEPYWAIDSQGQWITSLPDGKYKVEYPDGLDADPLRIKVTVSWLGHLGLNSAVSLETLVSMTPGRFRG
jgi:prepilin-type N-terminal cleavage/methylation domain-containing protein